jgi:hypothetical protein
MIFEGTTGRKETELRYHGNRPYGWFGLFDVDDDDALELVTIGDFQSHIDVLDFDPSSEEAQRLSVKWRRDIETDISKRKKWPQIGPRPVTDVTGDGRPDIVLNLFNDTDDGQWHVVVLDAMTGETLCDLPKRYLQGVGDVDGKTGAELFVQATEDGFVPKFGRIELLQIRGAKPAVFWKREPAHWCTRDLPALEPMWSTSGSDGMRCVPVDVSNTSNGRVVSFMLAEWMQRYGDSTSDRRLRLLRFGCGKDGKVRELGRAENLIGDVAMLSEADRFRIELPSDMTTEITCHQFIPKVVSNEPLGTKPSSPVVVRLSTDAPMAVVVEGAGRNVFAITPPLADADMPRVKWRQPGRGMADGSRATGVLAGDLDGDGGCEIVLADQAPQGHAVLVAVEGDGRVMWRHAFDRIAGDPPVWNKSALTFWWPGYFRDDNRVDLLVNVRRGLMHSDIGQLLDGRDGSTVWTKKNAAFKDVFHWSYGGIPLAMADLTGDKLDEIVSLYPVCFWWADGRTGELQVGRDLAARKIVPAWAAYGEPIVHDFTGDGTPDVLLDSVYILALLDLKGNAIWHGLGRDDYPTSPDKGNVGETTSTKHALVDFDSDGRFEIASAGYGDGVRAIDPKDGKRLWSLETPAPTCQKVSAADIDGWKGDELLYVAGTTLVAITGDRTAGRILWTWKAPASLSMPAIADVDGDGLVEIVVQDAAGTVHCLDSPKKSD